MYMREMGSVDLLTREGEIEIAKRIEEGLRHMVMAIFVMSADYSQILDMASQVENETMRIDELIDALFEVEAEKSRGRRRRGRHERQRRRRRYREDDEEASAKLAAANLASAKSRGARSIRLHPQGL